MLFVRTKIFDIRIVYKRSHNLVLHAHFSRTQTKNIREKRKNIREIIRMVKTICNASKMFGTTVIGRLNTSAKQAWLGGIFAK